jgi:hypothetical protein
MQRKQTSLLFLLEGGVGNPKCFLNSMKCLLATIKIQDGALLSSDSECLGRDELKRILLLMPFFMQEFLMFENAA